MAINKSTFATLPIEQGVRLLDGEHLEEAQKRLLRASDVLLEFRRLFESDQLNGSEHETMIDVLLEAGQASVGEVLDMLDPRYHPKPTAAE